MKIGKTIGLAVITVAAVALVLAGCEFNFYLPPWEEDVPEVGIYFSLEWTDNGYDEPHLYLTYPAPADRNTTDDYGEQQLLEPYDSYPLATGDEGADPGDIDSGIPNESTDFRGAVYYGDKTSGYPTDRAPGVELISDEDGSEVILVREFPFTGTGLTFATVADGSADDLTGLPIGTYAWIGIMQVYAFAERGQLAYPNDDVDAVLKVYQIPSRGSEPVQLAEYAIAEGTDVIGASVARVNCFYDDEGFEVYQILWDARILRSTTQIRSVAPSAVVGDDGTLVIRRPVQ